MKGYLARLVERAQPSLQAPAPSAHPRPPATAAPEWEEIVEMVAPPSTSPSEGVAARSADPLNRHESTAAPAPVVLEPSIREPTALPPALTLSSAPESAPFQVGSLAAAPEEPAAPVLRLSPAPVPAIEVAAPEAIPLAFVPPVPLRPPVPDTSPVNLEWPAPTAPVAPLESDTPQTLRMAAPPPEQPATVAGDRSAVDQVERPPSLVIGQLRVEVVRAAPGGAIAAPIPARPARTAPRTPPAVRLDGAVPSVQRFARGRF